MVLILTLKTEIQPLCSTGDVTAILRFWYLEPHLALALDFGAHLLQFSKVPITIHITITCPEPEQKRNAKPKSCTRPKQTPTE